MNSLPTKIISGGQTGADRAGLDFAIEHGIEHGGWCPAGRRSDDGPIPTRYKLNTTPEHGYEQRTTWNVRDSDATIMFNRGTSLSAGTALTLRICERMERPYLIVRAPAQLDQRGLEVVAREIGEFIAQHQPTTLNIAGNRERTTPGIGMFVKTALAAAWPLVETASVTAAMPRFMQATLFDERPVGRRASR